MIKVGRETLLCSGSPPPPPSSGAYDFCTSAGQSDLFPGIDPRSRVRGIRARIGYGNPVVERMNSFVYNVREGDEKCFRVRVISWNLMQLRIAYIRMTYLFVPLKGVERMSWMGDKV